MRSDRTLWILLGILGLTAGVLMINNDAGQTFGINNGHIASFVTGTLLVTVIGAGLITRARPGGQLLRQIALWLAIFVALIVGYRLYHGQPMFPGSQPVVPESGQGVAV